MAADEDRSVEFVLGALSPGERAGVAVARLYDRRLDCAIETLEAWLASLEVAHPHATADPRIWDRIVGALVEEEAALAGKHVEAMNEGDWTWQGERVEAKALWDDRTALIRCEPEAVERAHLQDEDEHIVVLAGDLVIGGRRFTTGDYLLIPKATEHPDMRTDGGCILFVQYRS